MRPSDSKRRAQQPVHMLRVPSQQVAALSDVFQEINEIASEVLVCNQVVHSTSKPSLRLQLVCWVLTMFK